MLKTIHTGTFDMDDAPVRLMDIHRRGVDKDWMQKRAAVLTEEISSIRPEPGSSFIHLIALGDSETYGPNRNADGFTKRANQDYHHTFVTDGHVYKHHQNKDPKKSSGDVKVAAYNSPMARVELVVRLDNDKWEGELQKIASGQDIPFSMACNVAYDVCTICKNKARSRAEYCDDMLKMAGQILDDGRQVYVDNPHPHFFDISGVVRPADRIAYSLQKVASAGVLTGADLAELDGLTGYSINGVEVTPRPFSSSYFRKLSTLRKLSDIEKEIEMVAPAESNQGIFSLCHGFDEEVHTPGIEDDELEQLSEATQSRISDVMAALGRVQITLPLRDFLRILLGPDSKSVSLADVEDRLPGIFTRMVEEDPDTLASDGSYDPNPLGMLGLPRQIQNIIEDMVPGMSINPDHVGNRATVVIVRKSPQEALTGGSRIRTIKSASDAGAAELLAREYAKYKLAALTDMLEHGTDEATVKLGVLQNYV